MDEEIEGGNGAVEGEATILLENGEPVAAVVSLPESEEITVDELNTDSDERRSDAVVIAEIEAEKEVAIAAIEAGVEEARIESEVERVKSWEEEAADLRENMRELTTQVADMMEKLSPVAVLPLTPIAPQEESAPEIMEEPEASLTTPEFMSDPTPSTVTEAVPESAVERVEAVLEAPARKRRRLI